MMVVKSTNCDDVCEERGSCGDDREERCGDNCEEICSWVDDCEERGSCGDACEEEGSCGDACDQPQHWQIEDRYREQSTPGKYNI